MGCLKSLKGWCSFFSAAAAATAEAVFPRSVLVRGSLSISQSLGESHRTVRARFKNNVRLYLCHTNCSGLFLSSESLPPSLLRLRLSPSPPPTKVMVTRTSGSSHSHTSRLLQSASTAATASSSRNSSGTASSKKRRLNDNDSETSSMVGGTVTKTRISQHASANGRITVDEVDLEGKYVRLSNKADEVREAFQTL